MPELFRIAVIGTNGKKRRYISTTGDDLSFSDRADALHWNRREAAALAYAFEAEMMKQGRTEKLQIEKA